VFRGFLLPSLAGRLGAARAAALSALLFALCHFRADTFAPLAALGLVFGAVFLRTNNLVPPIVLHSLWNVYVLAALMRR
jgi:membrane protease YdiL (CAAX protease family)